MTAADALDAFLLARLDEDEAAARAATPGPWQWVGDDVDATLYGAGHAAVVRATGFGDPWTTVGLPDQEHIARHDPVRVLADVAAKRAIIQEYAESKYESEHVGLGAAILYLAASYASHPDYDETWRP